MILQPLCKKLCLPTLANLLGTVDFDGSSPAIDYLLDALAGERLQTQLGDVLLLYSLDAETYPDYLAKIGDRSPPWFDGKIHQEVLVVGSGNEQGLLYLNQIRLLDAVFPQATLCRWLEAVGESERAKKVALLSVEPRSMSAGWFVCRSGAPWGAFETEAAARLDLKRRVLELFPEVERHIDVEYNGPESRFSVPRKSSAGDRCMVSDCNQTMIFGGDTFVLSGESPHFVSDGSRWQPTGCAPGKRSIVRHGGKTLLRRTLFPVDFLPAVATFTMPLQ